MYFIRVLTPINIAKIPIDTLIDLPLNLLTICAAIGDAITTPKDIEPKIGRLTDLPK